MSRALTVYTRKRDEDTPEITQQLERVMAAQGCSEPVARNLLKYAKFGIGPMANPQALEGLDAQRDRPRQSPPRVGDRTAASAAQERKQRMREQERRLREQEEQQEREVEAEEKARREEQARKRAGLTRLGPVLARQEEVDPLQPVQVEAPSRFEDDDSEDDSEDDRNAAGKDPTGARAKQKADGKRGQAEASGRRQGKKRRKRRRGGDSSPEEAGGGEGANQGGTRGAAASASARGSSPGADADRGRGRDSGASGAGPSSLMTEAQVLEMMGKDRKTQRGSMRAKSRIQKEIEEWESAKRENPEFWKAPKFSLCYSAETRKSRNY